ncbi:hypothetical protein RAB80_017246 [Fusarium oxysporum f. sp. vasinfectum]|nr:hypothetical protein RAB80_017246 [Fusarium oxysporum f. sp. vasinfectum]
MGTSRSAPQEVALRHRYPSGTGLSTESINTVKVIENKAEKALLLWGDLPRLAPRQCLHSLWLLPNPSFLPALASLPIQSAQ